MTGLFNTGAFTLHSGKPSNFLIDCESLADEDLASIAARVAFHLPTFQVAEGIPRGGVRFASALRKYETGNPNHAYLLVDDVLTSGASMEEMLAARRQMFDEVIGIVLFARGPCPPWVRAVWEMGEWLR